MWFFIVGSIYAAMLRGAVLALWAAALAFAAVLPTESGDAFYFAFGGQAGAVNAYGQRLWAVPGELIASDPMGSCLAVVHRVFNGTLFPGTAVALQRIGVDVELVKTCNDNCVEVNPRLQERLPSKLPRHGGEADGGADSGGAVLRRQDIPRGGGSRGRPAVRET
jgi:hypothetical protein